MRWPALLILLLVPLGAGAAASEAESEEPRDAVIDPATFDASLLARAIFDEANRARREAGLPPFAAVRAADAAAEIQAGLGWLPGQAPHTNPFPGSATLPERIEQVGLQAARAGENAARLPILDTRGATAFGIRHEDGIRTPINLGTGEALRPHTYASFATDIVQRWLASPGHRENLLNPRYTVLGCAVRLTQPAHDFAQVFAVQVLVEPAVKGRRR